MLRISLPALVLALSGLPGITQADAPLYAGAGLPTGLFLSLDRDADGYLDAAELPVSVRGSQVLDRADRNGDQRIDHREFLALLDRLSAHR